MKEESLEKIKKLQDMIDNSKSIVFFGGAGVSTESGLKDFRSVDGLYNMKYDYPPEEILSHDFFFSMTNEFYKFYKDKLLVKGINPNKAHLKLAEMEQIGKLSGIITQNIDNLHTLAGSKNVVELHGSINRNYCTKCNKFYEGFDFILEKDEPPRCTCGGLIKPDVVLYNESLNEDDINNAIRLISNADMLIIGGCSLTVYPAASFIRFFRGRYLVILNKSATQADYMANLVISEPIGEVLDKIEV